MFLEKVGGLDEFKKNLSYQPLDFSAVLGSNFKLVGVDYSGILTESKGFSGSYYLYESALVKVVVSESEIDKNHSTMTVISETINQYVQGNPATIEFLRGKKDEKIINIHWEVGFRGYSMTTMNLNKEEALQLAEKISVAADKSD